MSNWIHFFKPQILRWIALSIAAIALGVPNPSQLSADDQFSAYEFLMTDRPTILNREATQVYRDGLVPLWLRALEREDAELSRLTINTIGIAFRREVPEVLADKEKIVARLHELMTQPKQSTDVVRAAAGVLIQIDSRQYATDLAKVAKEFGQPVSELVEPALARWKSTEIQADWVERVGAAGTGSTMRLHAIDGVAATRATAALSSLEELAADSSKSIKIRLNAATAFGKIGSKNALSAAKRFSRLATKPKDLSGILAAVALQSNSDQPSTDFLKGLLKRESTIVQSKSLEQLFRIDKQIVADLSGEMIGSPDANVRRWCVEALLAKQEASRVRKLFPSLDDVNPRIRERVTSGLLDWAKTPTLKEVIIDEAMEQVQRDSWRSVEQDVVILASLDHKPAGSVFVDLLSFARNEVKVASAWGLCQLRMKEHLPAMLDHALSVHRKFKSGSIREERGGDSLQMAHLFNAFGDQQYKPAEQLIRAYLPKNLDWGTEARASACWATGELFQNDARDDLVELLTERMLDSGSEEPETDFFRSHCAIALGKMNAKSKLGLLRQQSDGPGSFSYVCRWAIEKMTGEKALPPKPRNEVSDDWFLSPVR